MIHVRIERRSADRAVLAFSIDGHALFAEAGKDIVCAGVSAIAVGTMNAVESLTGVELEHTMDKGLLKVTISDLHDESQWNKVQLLLESMVIMLKTIEQTYGSYIVIKESFKEGGQRTC